MKYKSKPNSKSMSGSVNVGPQEGSGKTGMKQSYPSAPKPSSGGLGSAWAGMTIVNSKLSVETCSNPLSGKY